MCIRDSVLRGLAPKTFPSAAAGTTLGGPSKARTEDGERQSRVTQRPPLPAPEPRHTVPPAPSACPVHGAALRSLRCVRAAWLCLGCLSAAAGESVASSKNSGEADGCSDRGDGDDRTSGLSMLAEGEEGGEDFMGAPAAPPTCLLYTSPSPRDLSTSRMPSSA